MASLYIVATPIGNLEDISFRAVKFLKEEVSIIFAEDTRVTRRLLDRYDISTPVESLNARTEKDKTPQVIFKLKNDSDVAFVTDAGTPGISDPGRYLVDVVRNELPDINVISIPGPSALTSAISISGLRLDEFVFYGFLPHKKGRQTKLKEIVESEKSCVLYESPHRVMKLLEYFKDNLKNERTIFIARELTKIHEESVRGSTEDVLDYYSENPDKVKGEFVVIVSKD